MSLLKSILGKRKFWSTSMFRQRFLKKIINVFFCDEMGLPYLYLTATDNKEFTGKSSLTSFCAESSEKKKQWKKLGWSSIFRELNGVVKARLLRIICKFVKEELPSNQVKIPFMNWLLVIIWKVNPFVASVTFSPISNCIQMIGEFLTATFKYTMRWKIFQWMKFLRRPSPNSRKLSQQKFHN